MARPINPDLTKPWKVSLPAQLAGRVEYALMNPLQNSPIYGSRNKLIIALLEWWIARESGTSPEHLPYVPSLEELRSGGPR